MDGVGGKIPVIQLPGRGSVVTGDKLGAAKKEAKPVSKPIIKRQAEEKKYESTGYTYPEPKPIEAPAQPKVSYPSFRIRKKLSGISGKEIGSLVEFAGKGKITALREDEYGYECEIEVTSIAF